MNVYFIQCLDENRFIKVGMTRNVEKRLETLQIGNPYELKILAVIPCTSDKRARRTEREVHKYFDHLRVRGEWFESSLEISKLNDFYIETKDKAKANAARKAVKAKLKVAK